MKFVLDAGAMLAFLNGEPGGEATFNLLVDNPRECYCHAINLAEVYYIILRRSDANTADLAIQDMMEVGVVPRTDFDTEFWKTAANLKARNPMALPDAFMLALANRLGATAVTTDHKEIDPIVGTRFVPILFIR